MFTLAHLGTLASSNRAPIPPLLSSWDAGGYWFDLPTSLTSSTTSAKVLSAIGTPTTVNPAIGGFPAYQLTGSVPQYFSNPALAPIFKTGQPWTVAIRLRATLGAVSNMVIWAAGYGFNGATIRGESNGEFPALTTNSDGATPVGRTSGTRVRFDDVCITWVYDGVTTTKIFVNGTLTTITNSTVNVPVTSPATLTTFAIGCHLLSAPNLPFTGQIKRAAVGQFAASDSEVQGLFNAWISTDYTLPIASSPSYLWIGDSITQGDLTASSAGFRYTMANKLITDRRSLNSIGQYNQGAMPNNRHGSLGGSDLTTQATNFATALGGKPVKLVIWMGGTNNMAAGNASAAAAAYSTALDTVWAQASALDSTVKIAVTTIIDMTIGNTGQTTIAPFNALLPAIWASKSYSSSLITWDAYTVMGARNGTDWVDTTHLNQVGSDKYFNNGLWPAISSYIASISPT